MGKKILTAQQVREIKVALESDYYGLHKKLSSQYKISSCAISDIKHKRKWKHVKIKR